MIKSKANSWAPLSGATWQGRNGWRRQNEANGQPPPLPPLAYCQTRSGRTGMAARCIPPAAQLPGSRRPDAKLPAWSAATSASLRWQPRKILRSSASASAGPDGNGAGCLGLAGAEGMCASAGTSESGTHARVRMHRWAPSVMLQTLHALRR